MSKTIKLEDRVYDRLTGLLLPKQSYSQTVERVLDLFSKVSEFQSFIEGQIAFKNHQKGILERQTTPQ